MGPQPRAASPCLAALTTLPETHGLSVTINDALTGELTPPPFSNPDPHLHVNPWPNSP